MTEEQDEKPHVPKKVDRMINSLVNGIWDLVMPSIKNKYYDLLTTLTENTENIDQITVTRRLCMIADVATRTTVPAVLQAVRWGSVANLIATLPKIEGRASAGAASMAVNAVVEDLAGSYDVGGVPKDQEALGVVVSVAGGLTHLVDQWPEMLASPLTPGRFERLIAPAMFDFTVGIRRAPYAVPSMADWSEVATAVLETAIEMCKVGHQD